jgi:imidazolonepropionase-like amidohydrolase
MRAKFILAALAALFVVIPLGVSAAAEGVIALKAARLFDGKSRTLVQNGVVIVQGDKIVDAGSNISLPPEAKVLDLGDATLSPGFMDAHSHLTFD